MKVIRFVICLGQLLTILSASVVGVPPWPTNGSFPEGLSGDFGPRIEFPSGLTPSEKNAYYARHCKTDNASGFHAGIDFPGRGREVRASIAGTADVSGTICEGEGQLVIIDIVRYCHLDTLYIHDGQFIPEGDIIGRTASHLDVKVDNDPKTNPLQDIYYDNYTGSAPDVAFIINKQVIPDGSSREIKGSGSRKIGAFIVLPTKDLGEVEIEGGPGSAFPVIWDLSDEGNFDNDPPKEINSCITRASPLRARYWYDWTFNCPADNGTHSFTVRATTVKGEHDEKSIDIIIKCDPTFIIPSSSELIWKNPDTFILNEQYLSSHIATPVGSNLVRADVPVSGIATGKGFARYRVEVGQGNNPISWMTLVDTTIAQVAVEMPNAFISGDASVHGNLTTWHTGLTEYEYPDSWARDLGIDGVNTIRLIVSDTDGNSVEDSATVTVGRVLGNSFASRGVSPDKRVDIVVPEHSLFKDFELIAIVPEDTTVDHSGLEPVGTLYRILPDSISFSKPVELSMRYSDIANPPDKLGIYRYRTGFFNPFVGQDIPAQWEFVGSEVRSESGTLVAKVTNVGGLYGLFYDHSPPPSPTIMFKNYGDQKSIRIPYITIGLRGSGDKGHKIQIRNDGRVVAEVPVEVDETATVWNVPFLILHLGDNALDAVQVDPAGNVSGPSDALTVTVFQEEPFQTASLNIDQDSVATGGSFFYTIRGNFDPSASNVAALHVTSVTDPSGVTISGGLSGVISVGTVSDPTIPMIRAEKHGEKIRMELIVNPSVFDEVSVIDKTVPPPPTIVSQSHPALIFESFEHGLGDVRAEDGSASLDIGRDFFSLNRFLNVTKISDGGMGVILHEGEYTLSDFPVVTLDYKFPPSAQLSLLVRVDGSWYDFVLTDSPKNYDKNVGIVFAANVGGIVADNTWRQLSVNLLSHLAGKIQPDGKVESIVLADWDVGGYRRLVGGSTPTGTIYSIDNFGILKAGGRTATFVLETPDASGISHFEYRIGKSADDAFWKVPRNNIVSTTDSTVTIQLAGDGLWTLEVTATDVAGNRSRSAYYTVFADASPPLVENGGILYVSKFVPIQVKLHEEGRSDGLGIDGSSIRIRIAGKDLSAGDTGIKWDEKNGRVLIDPIKIGLTPTEGQSITATLVSAKDLAGNDIAEPFTWQSIWTDVEIKINELSLAKDNKWVEFRIKGAVDLSRVELTTFEGPNVNLGNAGVTGAGETFVVVRPISGLSDDAVFDVLRSIGKNKSEIVVQNLNLFSTDQQLAVRINGDTEDVLIWSNMDGKGPFRTIKTNNMLVAEGHWHGTFTLQNRADAALSPPAPFSLGRLPKAVDTDRKEDWAVLIIPTPGQENIFIPPPSKGDVLLTEVGVKTFDGDYVEFLVKKGPLDIRGVVLSKFDGEKIPLVTTPLEVSDNTIVLVHFSEGVTELSGDVNGNGAVDIYPGAKNLNRGDEQFVLKFGAAILDGMIWTNGNAFQGRGEQSDAQQLVNLGEWVIGGPVYTPNDAVLYPEKPFSIGRIWGNPDTNRKEDWVVQYQPTPGRPNIQPAVPESGDILVNEFSVINVFGPDSAWAELYNATDKAFDISSMRLTDLDGKDDFISPDGIFTLLPKGFAVIRWDRKSVSSTERDAMGDINNNGYRESFLRDQKPSGTDDQLALTLNGRMIDAVSWTVGRGRTSQFELKDNQNLTLNGQWVGTFTDTMSVGDLVRLKSGSLPMGRQPNGADSNRKEDWDLSDPTPGEPNKAFGEDKVAPISSVFPIPPAFDSGGIRYVSLSTRYTMVSNDNIFNALDMQYRIDDGAFQSFSTPFFLENTGIHVIEFFAIDLAGNVETSKDITVLVDGQPPVTSLGFNPDSGLVDFNSKDDASGVRQIFFGVDGDTKFIRFMGPFVLSAPGTHTISFFAVDNVGNTEPPNISRDIFGVPTPQETPVIDPLQTPTRAESIAITGSTQTNVTLMLRVDDVEKEITIPMDGRFVFPPFTTTEGTLKIQVSPNVVGPIPPFAETEVFVDRTPPSTALFKKGSVVEEKKISASPSDQFLLTGSDTLGVGVAQVFLNRGNGFEEVPNAFRFKLTSGVYRLQFYSVDAIGNTEPINEVEVTVIGEPPPAFQDVLPPRTTLTIGDPKLIRVNDSATYVTASTPLSFLAVDDFTAIGDSKGLGPARINVAVDTGVYVQITGLLTLGGLGASVDGKHTVSYRATDVVGNVEDTRIAILYIDATAPVTTDTKTPAANKNGWNTADVSVSLSSVDLVLSDSSNAGSGVKETRLGIDGATPTIYTTASTLSAEGVHTLSFFSVDNIGNTEPVKTDTVRIDKTIPVVNVNRAPPANNNNWNRDPVFVAYTAADILSGIDTSVSDLVTDVLTMEAAGQTTAAFAVDLAGNTTTVSVTNINIDSTTPVVTISRTPSNLNGWSNFTVTVIFAETDVLSGIDTPAADVTLATEGFGQSATGVSMDLAGNTTTVTVSGINIDLTNPVVTGVANPAANLHGWRNTSVTVDFSETDALSGIDTPAVDANLTGEGAGQSATRFAVDIAGNTGTMAVTDINIDFTRPVLSSSRAPAANTNGWNNSTITVSYAGMDTLSGIDASLTDTVTDVLSSEGAGQTTGASAVDKAGNVSTVTVTDINIDLTAPVVGAARTPDANVHSWNNTVVTVSYTATDALSGVDTANSDLATDVLNMEGVAESTSGFAVDLAGNNGTATVSNINIDFTAPAIAVQFITPDSTGFGSDGRSWWKTPVTADFNATDTLSGLDAGRSNLSFTLPNEGKDKSVTGIAVDKADNTSTLTVGGINIDLTAPNVSLQIGTPQVVDGQTYIKSTTPLTINGVDTLSGMKSIAVSTTPSGLFAISGQTAEVVSRTLSAEGQIALTFSGTDIATNKSADQSATVIVDNTAPATSISIDITDTTGTVLIPQSEITLSAIDGPVLAPAVGADRIEYEIDGGSTQTYSGPFSVSGIGSHTLTYRAIDRLGNIEATHTFNFTVSPALSANKFVSFAPRVLVWLNDKGADGDDDGEDDDGGKDIPGANVSVLKTIFDSAPILLYNIVETSDSFVSFMRTDSYNLYVIIGDQSKLGKEQEWELSERVRMGGGLIASSLDEIDLPTKDKGEHEGSDDKSGDNDKGKSGDKDEKGKSGDKNDKDNSGDDESGKASKNLLGLDVSGEHSNKNIKVALTGLAISYIGDYQTTDKAERVRELAVTAVGDGFIMPDGKDKEPEPSVVSNVFGSGKTVFFAFDLGQSATPGNSGATGNLLNAAIKKVTPTKEVFIPDGRTAIGIGVQSKVVPLNLAVRIEEVIPAGASVVNKLDGNVQDNAVIWNITLDVNKSDTVQYVLGLPDQGQASVTTSADVSYVVRGNYILFDTLKLTLITEKDLPNLLDQAISQLNALNPADKDDENKVEDAVEELQKQKSTPPTTDKNIEDAIENVLEIIRDLDGVDADVQKVSDVRDTLDKVVMVYGRLLSN